jgi:hypothetical protein
MSEDIPASSSDEQLPARPTSEDDERALRVSQLDADELDTGLVQMLAGKITSALSAFSVSQQTLSHSRGESHD